VSFESRPITLRFTGVPPAPLALLAEEGAEHAEKILGMPAWLWQLANLVLFLGVLVYFVARPLTEAFRKRQLEVEERLKEARKRREEATRFEEEIRERTARLELEVAQIRAEGLAEGESARAALEERAVEEAERVREASRAEIERRLAAAKAELRQAAAGLTATSATDILSREITEEDRRRLLEDSVSRLKEAR
jgi:F-type H+-transporting ATPase subunit b